MEEARFSKTCKGNALLVDSEGTADIKISHTQTDLKEIDFFYTKVIF